VRLRRSTSFLLFLAIAASSNAASHPHSNKGKVEDASYVYALAAANRFLNAWQIGDLETGMLLISDHVRQSRTPAELEQLFSSVANRAYEIGHGKGGGSRYSFPLALVTEGGGRVHRRYTEIVIVKSGKNDWLVDKLP
jgi:hypothetical protein